MIGRTHEPSDFECEKKRILSGYTTSARSPAAPQLFEKLTFGFTFKHNYDLKNEEYTCISLLFPYANIYWLRDCGSKTLMSCNSGRVFWSLAELERRITWIKRSTSCELSFLTMKPTPLLGHTSPAKMPSKEFCEPTIHNTVPKHSGRTITCVQSPSKIELIKSYRLPSWFIKQASWFAKLEARVIRTLNTWIVQQES